MATMAFTPAGASRRADQRVHAGRDQRPLRRHQDVGVGVHPHGVAQRVDPQGLLHHGGLVGVARRLVVVRKRDRPAAHPHDEGRVDLAVRVQGPPAVGLAQRAQRDPVAVLLHLVDVLHNAGQQQPRHQVVARRVAADGGRELRQLVDAEERAQQAARVGLDV